MRHTLTLGVLAAAAMLAGCSPMSAAETGPQPPFGRGWGQGPGYGPGYGMMGPGYDWQGPRGYGPAGPGMMGPGGYGPPGPGMMGPGMMGPGMMGGWRGLPSSLTAEQRSRIAEIQREQRSRQWPLVQQMHELAWGGAAADPGAADEQAQRRDYDRIAALQKQMFENMLDSRKRIDAVLTPQQRDELRRGWRPER